MTVSENQNPGSYQDLKEIVGGYLSQQSVLARSMDNVRVAYDEKSLDPNTVVLWPEKSVYICADAAIAMFSSLLKEQLKNTPGAIEEDHFMDLAVQVPALTLTCQSWFKGKVLLNPQKEFSAEELESFGKIRCSELAKLPCWGLAVDMSKQNIIWNDQKVKYVIYSRYFLTTPTENTAPAALEGEAAASINNLTTNIITEDNNLSIGPIIILSKDKTIDEVNEEIVNEMLSFNLKAAEGQADVNIEELKSMLMDSFKVHTHLFRIFGHMITSLNTNKDANGNEIKLPPLPTVIQENATTKAISVAEDIFVVDLA